MRAFDHVKETVCKGECTGTCGFDRLPYQAFLTAVDALEAENGNIDQDEIKLDSKIASLGMAACLRETNGFHSIDDETATELEFEYPTYDDMLHAPRHKRYWRREDSDQGESTEANE